MTDFSEAAEQQETRILKSLLSSLKMPHTQELVSIKTQANRHNYMNGYKNCIRTATHLNATKYSHPARKNTFVTLVDAGEFIPPDINKGLVLS